MDELELLIEKRIGEVGDDELMKLWLKRCEIKLEKAKEVEKRLSEKDPVIIGGIIGAFKIIPSIPDAQRALAELNKQLSPE